jgi:predicted transcriptional regulator
MKPTDSELLILRVLWDNQPCSVRFVNERLNEERTENKEIGYTTTLKLMQIMMEKGLLKRQIDGRKHSYSAVIRQSETQSVLLEDFLQAAFGGSAMKLVLQALGNHETSKEELDEIKALIEQIEGGEL